MGIRETLNENPRLTTGITAGIVVVVLIYILWSSLGGGAAAPAAASGKAYFSVDDGQNYFAEDAKKVPPFDYNGKPAVRAHVYKCDGKTFVNHLERYTPDGKKRVEEAMAKAGSSTANDPTLLEAREAATIEYKSPGDKEWVKSTDPKAGKILTPKCANPGEAEELMP